MKDHHRKPLQEVSTNISGAPVLNRLENMALGGRAGLKLRKKGSAVRNGGSHAALEMNDHVPLSQSASDNSTFALSTDVSMVSVQPTNDGRRGSPPRFQLEPPGTPSGTTIRVVRSRNSNDSEDTPVLVPQVCAIYVT